MQAQVTRHESSVVLSHHNSYQRTLVIRTEHAHSNMPGVGDTRLDVVPCACSFIDVTQAACEQQLPLREPAEHQMSDRNRPGRQKPPGSLRRKASVAARHKWSFCQILGERLFLGPRVCLDATVYVVAGVFSTTGKWGGSTDIHVLCKGNNLAAKKGYLDWSMC